MLASGALQQSSFWHDSNQSHVSVTVTVGMAQSSSSSSDMARISIERVEDWNRIRDNFTDAMLNTLNDRLAQGSSQHVRDAVTAHLLQAGIPLFFRPSHATNNSMCSGGTRRSILQRKTYASTDTTSKIMPKNKKVRPSRHSTTSSKHI
jgi:hypothetical protein